MFWDEASGRPLNTELVIKARLEEMNTFRKMRMYHKVPISECLDKTGKQPIGTKWVDVNKR